MLGSYHKKILLEKQLLWICFILTLEFEAMKIVCTTYQQEAHCIHICG